MLAYAATRPAVVDRHPHPNFMLAIIGAHVALVALVMSAKMEIQRHKPEPPIIVDTITEPPPPPLNPVTPPRPNPQPPLTTIRQPVTQIPLPPVDDPLQVPTQPIADPLPIPGGGAAVTPVIPRPIPTPVTVGPKLITPPSELKPPYPAAKLLNEEEAVLKLRLTIDAQGRVVAVDPVGRADPTFLAAARRHLLAHWRFRPATEDGRAVASTSTITLHFELDG